MIMAHMEFWFEYASTYSYLSVMRADKLAKDAGVTIAWRPFLLGPIFQKQGWNDSPFNIYPAKGRYMWRDMERLCDHYGFPFQRPAIFPQNGLMAARLTLVGLGEGWGADFIKAVFKANFAENRNISDTAVLSDLLRGAGAEPEAAFAAAQSPEIKAALKTQTERAMELCIFGAPTFVAGGELFWGNDRLEHALTRAARPSG
jgi:2-hydroxychromene-2-carboxylate isomerase